MTLQLYPHLGAGPVHFNMPRTAIQRLFGDAPVRERRGNAREHHYFARLDMYVYYDDADLCNAIEFGSGADIALDGYALFSHSAEDTRDWAYARDRELIPDEGFISLSMGLAMYAPFIDAPDLCAEERLPESFLLFREGYYDNVISRLRESGLLPDKKSEVKG